jgi:hypothetical protein
VSFHEGMQNVRSNEDLINFVLFQGFFQFVGNINRAIVSLSLKLVIYIYIYMYILEEKNVYKTVV